MLGLGIDIGTTSTKVVVAAADGPLVVCSRPTAPDAGRLVADVLALAAEAVSASGALPQAVGIASMAESGWLLDRSGEALGPMVSWTESRPGHEIQALVKQLGWAPLFEATGVRPGPKPPLAFWLQLRHEQPGLVRRVRWAGAADLVHLALTGQLVTDHTLAGRSLAYRLPAPGQPCSPVFDAQLLAEAGMTPDQLPRVCRPGDPLAQVLPGRPLAGCPVLVAGHDHQVAAWAGGVRRPGQVADSVGTAEAVLSLTQPVVDRASLGRDGMSLTRAVDGATEAVVAGSPCAGAFVQQVADAYANGDVARLLDGLTESALASGSGLLPYPRGRQAPAPDPQARVRSWGPGPLPDPGTVALEAVSCQAQWLVQRQAEKVGAREELVVIGEAVRRSPAWQRIKASLADRPARLVTAVEPVACGAALLALVRAGLADPGSTLPWVGVEAYPGLSQPYRRHLRAFVAAARQRL